MQIKAITFDVGGTLIEPWPSVGHVYAEVAAGFGVDDVAPERLIRNFARAWKSRAGFDYSREGWFDLVREAFGTEASRLPPEYFPAVFNRFARADAWRIFDDVVPALQMLASRGVRLGIISNWDDRLRPLLTNLNLSRYFPVIVISCEAGVVKPDRRIFERAVRELDVTPAELVHVGDDPLADVVGAGRVGALGRQIVRCGRPAEPWQIPSLLELPTILDVDKQR